MTRICLLGLAVLLAACGKKEPQETYTPDLSTFEGAVDAYVKAYESSNAEYAENLFTAAEREFQVKELEKDLREAGERKVKYKMLKPEAEQVPGRTDAYILELTRTEHNADDDKEIGSPKRRPLLFVREDDGSWRINMRELRKMQDEQRQRASQPPSNQPSGNQPAANVPGNQPAANTPGNQPAANTPAGNGG